MTKYWTILILLFSLSLLTGETTYSDSLLLSAKEGNAEAQNKLGICYDQGLGVERNKAKAVKYFRLAAEQGYADAQYNMAANSYHKKSEMLKWYKLAAEQNHPGALSGLGQVYFDGNGVTKNYKTATGYFLRAAELGDATGQFWYGMSNYWGHGVLKNYAEAARNFQLAAEQQHTSAMTYLGFCFFNGNGVEKNLETAYFWHLLANAFGNSSGGIGLVELEQLLTTEQKNNAQAQAQIWLDTHKK